jgi:large subunit ribosomal protein L24
MNKIRKGDKVVLNTGKDKGKQGVVLSVLKTGPVSYTHLRAHET